MKNSIILSAAILPAGCLAAVNASAQQRPNIVLAFGDDYGRYASIYADVEKDNGICELIETPNFDRIAREGVLFTNSHVPAPSSTACRSSLLSGQYFWRTGKGAFLHGTWDETIPSYPLLLEENGYHIGFSYKAWGPGPNLDAPYGGARTRYQKRGSRFNSFSQNVTKAGRNNYEKAKQELCNEVKSNFRDFLSANTGDKPFCYWWGPTNTHRSWQKGSGKDIWGIDPDKLKGKMPEYLPDVPEIREDFADYLGECMAFDAGLGALISVLEETGELDNTLIVVSGDHGIPGFPRAKANLYDLGTRVGLAIRYPATIKAGRVVTDFVNLMDLAPTFLEFGATEIPEVMTGRSIKQILESGKKGRIEKDRNYVVTGRERHVVNARPGNMPYPSRAIVTDRYKYIRNFEPSRWPVGTYTAERKLADLDGGPTKNWFLDNFFNSDYKWYLDLAFGLRPSEELYDLKKDPDELHNVAQDPKYRKVRQELSDRLEEELRATDDPRMQVGPCIFDSREFVDPE